MRETIKAFVFSANMFMIVALLIKCIKLISHFQDLDKRPHIVIATPGRLADHIENNSTFTLKNVKYLVLDEADRLLEGW